MRVFGCNCVVRKDRGVTSMDTRGDQGTFLGYSEESGDYIIKRWNERGRNGTVTSRNVDFFKDSYKKRSTLVKNDIEMIDKNASKDKASSDPPTNPSPPTSVPQVKGGILKAAKAFNIPEFRSRSRSRWNSTISKDAKVNTRREETEKRIEKMWPAKKTSRSVHFNGLCTKISFDPQAGTDPNSDSYRRVSQQVIRYKPHDFRLKKSAPFAEYPHNPHHRNKKSTISYYKGIRTADDQSAQSQIKKIIYSSKAVINSLCQTKIVR